MEEFVKIKIIPLSQRARNRIREHGEIMFLLMEKPYNGSPAFLAGSLDETFHGRNWMGWFVLDKEAKFEKV